MASFTSVLFSSVGKKFINAVTGFMLFGFIIVHLFGNLTLLTGNADRFNAYGNFLVHKTEFFIYVFEIGLVIVFALHMLTAILVWWDKQTARPIAYKKNASGGPTSKKTWSSTTMIYTGTLTFIFLVYHLISFKYGPGMAEGYTTVVDGEKMRDLYRLSMDLFSQRGFTIWYIITMALLGLHLRHGFWSAFQSLGLNHPRLMPILYRLGVLVALVMGFGFVFIPAYIYMKGGAL